MAVYNVTAPNGRNYRVTAPAGTEEEQLYRYVQSIMAKDASGLSGPVGGPQTIEYGTEASYKSENAPWYRDLADVGVAGGSGVVKATSALIGLGSYVPGLNKLADPAAAALQDFGTTIDEWGLSDRQKEINAELGIRLQDAVATLPEDATISDYYEAMKQGGGEAWEYMKDHPTQVFNLIASSVPYIVGGGVASKAIKGTAELAGLNKVANMGRVTSGAVGEGTIVGGQAVTDVIRETDSVGEYSADRLKALGTIPTTTAISLLGGQAAQRLRGLDIDTAVAGKVVDGTDLLSGDKTGLIKRTAVGTTVEGVEETLQSGTEKYWENYGVDKSYNMLNPKLLKDVGPEAVIGGVTGAGQGGMINIAAGLAANSQDEILETDPEVENFINDLDEQQQAAEQEEIKVNEIQEDLFQNNQDMLTETLRLVGKDGLNVVEQVADSEIANSIENPVERAIYILMALKAAPAQEFSDGKNTSNSKNIINGLENAIEALAPGSLEQIALQEKKEKRRTHAATFPNEREWKNDAKKENFLQQRIAITNPNSEIGRAFREWQDNDEIVAEGKYDTDSNGLPTEAAVKSFLGQQEVEINPADYTQALDEHAQLQEEKESRSVEDQQMIDQNLAQLLARRKEAIDSGNFEELINIENDAANTIEFTAEWAAAKKEADKKPAKEPQKKEVVNPNEETQQEVLELDGGTESTDSDTTTTEETTTEETTTEETTTEETTTEETTTEETTTEETIEAELNPFREFNDKEGKRPNKKHIRYKAVAEEIGYGFEDNDTSDVYQAVFDAINKSASDKRINKLMREVKDLVEADAIADPNMRVTQPRRLGKWQQAVIPFLMDAARRGTLDDYRSFSTDKGWQWFNNSIAEAIEAKAGVKLSESEIRNAGKRVNDAINAYKDKQIELGKLSKTRETAEEFNERLDNKWLKKVLSQGEARDTSTVADNSVIAAQLEQDPNDAETFDLDTETLVSEGGFDERTQDQQIRDAAATDATVASAGGSQVSDATTDKDLEDFVNRNANKADPKQVARVQQAQMDSLKAVDTAHQDTNFKKKLSSLWDQNNLERGAVVNGQGNKLTELSYLKQPAEVQDGWIVGVQLALDNRRLDTLPEYFESLVYAHSDRIEANIKRSKTNIKPKKKSDNVRTLGKASQEKVAEIQARGKAVRLARKEKQEAAAAEKKRKAQERKDAKNAKIKAKRLKEEIAKNKAERKAKEAKENEKTDSSRKPEGKTIPKKPSASSTRKKGSGTSADQDGRRSVKKVRKIQKSSFDRIDPETTSRELIDNLFKTLLGKSYKKVKKRIIYYETEGEAYSAGWGTREEMEKTSAFVSKTRGEKGERVAGEPDVMVFILENIPKGQEASIFMHEVGGHIGLQNILNLKEQKALEKKIDTLYEQDVALNGNNVSYFSGTNFLESGAQSKEHFIARHAVKRALAQPYQDKDGRVSPETARAEKIAFFLQVATELGFRPSETTETGKILNKFKQAFIKFLREMQLIDANASAEINAQDIVDMAYGAAKMELESGFRFGRKLPSQKALDDIENNIVRSANDPSRWDAETEAEARIRFPKNDKNKYITPKFLPTQEWREFQIAQGRAEKKFKQDRKVYVEKMLKDAAANEARMANPDGKQYSKKQNEVIEKDGKEIDNAVKENYPDSWPQWQIFKGMAGQASKGLVFKYDFINRYKDKLPALQEAQDVIQQSNMLARSLKKMVDDIVVRRRGMKKDRVRLVNQMIEVATSRQVWPADPGIEGRTVKVNKAFKELFEKKLNAKERELVMDVFRHGEKTMAMRRSIAKLLQLPDNVFGLSSLEGPYAPLRRTGKHIVVLKSQELKNVEAKLKEESIPSWERKQAIAKQQKLKENGNHFVYKHFLNAAAAKSFRDQQKRTGKWAAKGGARYTVKANIIGEGTSDFGVLQKVYSQLENSNVIPSITGDKETQALLRTAFKTMLNKMYAESLEETNARQGQQKRQGKGIAGYDQDMLSSFATNGRSEASLIANMRYGQEINVSLGRLRKQAEEFDESVDDQDASMLKVYNMMTYHYNSMLNKKAQPFTDGVASTVTAWFLTTSLSYHLQNATQTVAVAVPIIAADFNSYSKTMSELTEAYAIAHKMISYDKKVPFLGSKEATWTVNIDLSKAPPDLVDLLTNLDMKEILDLGIEQDLADTNAAETGFKTVDATLKAAGTMSHRLYQIPRGVEGYNRIATAITAYRLAVKNPKVMKTLNTNPLDYATKKVQDTQGDFTADGAPAAFKWVIDKPLGKLLVQYKKFPLLMAMNYLRSFNMIFTGATAQEKLIGFRALRNLIAHTAVLSGIRGLPLVANIMMVNHMYLALLGDDEDELMPNRTDGSLERKIDSMFPDNPEFAQMLYRGVGPSFLGVDLSMKLSHGTVFQIMPFTDFELSEAGYKDLGLGVFGAAGSAGLNVFRGFEFMTKGNYYRGIESMMPKGIKDPMEAWRFMAEGYTTKAGDLRVPPADFKTMELVFKALGIPGTEITKMKWKASEQFQIKKFFTEKQKKLRREYLEASKNKDNKAMVEIARKWYILQDNKDAIRSFFNNAPSAIRRTDIRSLTGAETSKRRLEDDLQQEMGSGRFKRN